ncbi:MAG: YbaK/EbsC family protein [Lachnospiraceae bacterium]|nr:YbaK/EbsC family protein [Lachnospiraceae bacterium]
MSYERARQYLEEKGFADRIRLFEVSSATVELAAKAVGTEPGRIAKSLTFKVEDKPVMILTAGDVKIDNAKYRHFFHAKAKMLTYDEVEPLIGHAVGGVCPFGIEPGVTVYLDDSLKRYDVVYPACGTDNSAVELSIADLEACSGYREWIDVCKGIDG